VHEKSNSSILCAANKTGFSFLVVAVVETRLESSSHQRKTVRQVKDKYHELMSLVYGYNEPKPEPFSQFLLNVFCAWSGENWLLRTSLSTCLLLRPNLYHYQREHVYKCNKEAFLEKRFIKQ